MKLTRHHVECIYLFNNKDLSWLDLSGLDLSSLDLEYINLSYADLECANLKGANLRNANLEGINLSYANLERTNLYNANINNSCLFNCIGNGKEIITLQTPYYTVNLTKDFMSIGCRSYTYDEWYSFSDDDIYAMDDDALEFWTKYKELLKEHYNINFKS